MVDYSLNCPISTAELFSGNLDTSGIITCRQTFESNITVFAAGTSPCAVYIQLCGKAVLFSGTGADRTYISFAEPNCVYGLIESLADASFTMTMKTVSKSEFQVIARKNLINFIRTKSAFSYHLVEILGRLNHLALNQLRIS